MAATLHHPSALLFFLLTMLLRHLCLTSETDSCPVTIQIDPSGSNGLGTASSGGNQQYTFTDLDTALDHLQFQSGNDTVCINLIPGEHTLGYSHRVIEGDVVISGGGQQVVNVVCCNASEENLSESGYDQFPLRFGDKSRSVVRGIQFKGCARPLLFYEAWSVTLEDCSFSLFTQSAVEIYNTPYITISNCSFTNNTSLGIGTIQYSGNAGALSIGFNTTFPNTTQSQILIQDSIFNDNVANVSRDRMETANAVLSSKIYTQRGGGMAGYFGAAGLEINFLVEGCTFGNNSAQDSGGGIYINLSGARGMQANMTVRKSNFSENFATVDGGGLEVTFDTVESVLFPSFLLVQDCNFTQNRASNGGAFKPVQLSSQGNLNYVRIERSMFQQNHAVGGVELGAVMHLQTFNAGLGASQHVVQNTDRIEVKDCMFIKNIGKHSVVFVNYNQVNFTGINKFIANIGPSIRVTGTLLSLSGQLQFISNRNHHEGPSGTLYVTSFAQVLLNPGVRVSFVNNIGRDGGAIVVKSSRISSGFARTLYNPQCFLQFHEPQVSPTEWADHNVTLEFQGNMAILAPVLYISSLDACSWFNNSGVFFDTNITEKWTFMQLKDNYVIQCNESTDCSDLYIQTEIKDLRINGPLPSVQCQEENSTDVCAYPGQDIQLNVTALDQFSHTTSGFLLINTKQSTRIEFNPTIVEASVMVEEINFQYNSSEEFTSINVTLESSFSVTKVSRNFILHHVHCPPGFHPVRAGYCECEKRAEVLICDPNKEFVLLREGLWGAPPNWSHSLMTYTCPANYCNCTGSPRVKSTEGCALVFKNSSLSCNPDRKGVLCGECRESYGVGMLTMKCRKFTASFNMYYWLLPMLVLIIVVVVVVVVKVGVPIPALLLGPLFYIQVSPTAVSQFNDSLRLFPDIMDCIESTLALYVPYDFSLHQQLTALESYGLRYITPLLTLVVLPIAMRIKYRSHSWYGVWTLLLLMYARAVETSASLLFCPTLTNITNQSVMVWFFDGSVNCYSGSHLGLTIMTVLFMLVGVLLIAPVAVIAYQKEISKKFSFLDRRHFEMISLAFVHSYKDVYRWWAPFELVRRYIFLAAVIFTPGYLTVPLSIAGVLLAIQWFIQPYKDHMANITEAFCLTVLVIVLCLGDTTHLVTLATRDSNFTLWPLFYLPVVVGFVCLSAVIGRQIWKLSKAWWYKRKMQKKEGRNVVQGTSIITGVSYKVSTTVVGLNDCESSA